MITNSDLNKDVFNGLVKVRISEKKDGDFRIVDSLDFKEKMQKIRNDLNVSRIIAPVPEHKGNVLFYNEEDLIVGPAGVNRTRTFADGYIITTKDPQKSAVMYLTADCPIVIVLIEIARKNYALGVLHCGWRPLAEGILHNFMQKIDSLHIKGMLSGRSRRRSLRLLITPGINACCFVVGEDVVSKLSKKFNKTYFVDKKYFNGKKKVDLYKICWGYFEERGAKEISSLKICTKCGSGNGSRFFSHRRGDKERNMVAVSFSPQIYNEEDTKKR